MAFRGRAWRACSAALTLALLTGCGSVPDGRARGGARSPLAGPPIGPATVDRVGIEAAGLASDPTGASDGSWAPNEGRVEGIAGRVLVVPLAGRPWADEGWLRAATVPVRYDGGGAGNARLVRAPVTPVTPAADARTSSTADPARWLGFVGRWRIAPQDKRMEPGLGVWLLVIDAPPAGTRSMRVGERRLRFTALAPAAPSWGERWGGQGSSPALERILSAASGSPLLRFRARLARGGPAALQPAPGAGDAFEEPLLEALAQSTELRAAHTLARLARTDVDLASALARRLAAVVDFGAGVRAPAWPAGDRETDALFSDVLDPDATDAAAASKARAWLETQPKAAVWVIDDAGVTDAVSEAQLSTIGLANLTDRPVPAWVAVGPGATPDPVTLPPWNAVRAPSATDGGPGPGRGQGPELVRVRVDRSRHDAAVAPAPIPVTPPGLRVGPLLADWTMPAWVAGQERVLATDPAWATAALVQRDAEGWTLLVESLSQPGVQGPDTVRVWLGPRTAPTGVIRVPREGSAVDELGRSPATATTGSADDRWWAQVRVPESALDDGRVLRFAVERVDARGVRSTWPRPQLPWQEEPGRAAIDTRAWQAGR
jgi:hypothetical protein